jgi:uncharacterized protein (TIGR03086 family)
MDIVELHERALEQTGQIVAGVASSQRELPTPCTEWNVEALLNHMITVNWMFAGLAEGKPPESESQSNGDAAVVYRQSADALNLAWQDSGRLEKTYQLPFGELNGEGVLGIHVIEAVVHGWDLAKATGQQPAYEPALVETATQGARASFNGPRGPGMPFAPEVPVSGDLPAIDRLAAFLGRQP